MPKSIEAQRIKTYSVAPHVGAWIETDVFLFLFLGHHVAPHVGAWIETPYVGYQVSNLTVAPHVGAWIETAHRPAFRRLAWSPPMWGRGLKLIKKS